MQGSFLNKCFENHIKKQREKLLNKADIYGIHFQVDGATIKYTSILNILDGWVNLPVPVQKIVDCKVYTKGGHKKDVNCFLESFFDSMNDLDPEKKLLDLHIFDGESVCRKAKNIEGCLYYAIMYCWVRAYL